MENEQVIGYVVMGRAPKNRDIDWKQWEPLALQDHNGKLILLRRACFTLFDSKEAARSAVQEIVDTSIAEGHKWHKRLEININAVIKRTA